ncbi:unnamed protein product [Meganyctiphanes norvegica]|uniref:Uncharacterized protein n=1 Tax=Meganyctiphanes norvegica TaxID=48144 RepID=A0AAV2S506_MEGNR
MATLSYLSFLCVFVNVAFSYEINGSPSESVLNINSYYSASFYSSSSPSSSCPAAEDIKPCVCIIKYGDINLDCTGVTSNKELKAIFHNAHFPNPNFREFYMAGNKGITVLEKEVFGNVTFKIIFVMRSALQKVEVGALDASNKTAVVIDLLSNNITSFPFHTIHEFSALEELRLTDNHLSSMPLVKSDTVKMLDLSMNPLMKIPSDALRSLTAIELLSMGFTNISHIPPGLFKNVSSLQYVLLGYNNITSLPTDIITCSSPDVVCGNNWLKSVSLSSNPIAHVELNAFEAHPGLRVEMTGSALTSLNETVWRPLIEANVTLTLEDNRFSCKCDMAWLAVKNPPNLAHVWGECSNGTPLQHLDPKVFANCTSAVEEPGLGNTYKLS